MMSENLFQVELLQADGTWVDSGKRFATRFAACEFGLDHGGDKPGHRYHSVYGYDTEDHTWRISHGTTWAGRPF